MPCHKNRLDRSLLSSSCWESHVRFLWAQQPPKANPHLGCAQGWANPLCSCQLWAAEIKILALGSCAWNGTTENTNLAKGRWWKVAVVERGSPSLFFQGGLLCFFLCPFLFVPFQQDPGEGDSCAAPVSPVCGSEDAAPIGGSGFNCVFVEPFEIGKLTLTSSC